MVVLANTTTKPFSLLVNGVDIITPAAGKGAVPLGSIRWTDNGHNGQSSMEFLHEDPTKAFAIPAAAEVIFLDQAHGGLIFGGRLMARELTPLPSQQGRAVRCTVSDYSVYLDWNSIGPEWNSGSVQADYAIVPSVLSYMGVPLKVYLQNSTNIGTYQTFAGIPARSIVEQCLSLAQGINNVPMGYWVTHDKELIYSKLSDFSYIPPINVTDVHPAGAGKGNVENLTLEYDESEVVNSVYVRGASKAATGWVTDYASVAIYARRQAVVDRPRATTLTIAQQYGAGYLVEHKDATLRGRFDVDGAYCLATGYHWRAEQNFTITNAALSLSAASFRTYSVETVWLGGNGAHRHTVHFGGLPRSGLARILRGLATAGVTELGSAALPTSGQRIIGTIG